MPNDVRRFITSKYNDTRNPHATYKIISADETVSASRDTKQVDNIQQQYRNTPFEIDNLTRLSVTRSDIFRFYSTTPQKLAIFTTDFLITLMKQQKVWYTDTTFNMWSGHITGVVFKANDFEEKPTMTAFIAAHQLQDFATHCLLLTQLYKALKLTEEQQKNYVIVSDGEASLINAWQKVFPHIKHVLCAVHFAKNISDYMKYACNPPPSPALQKFVMHLFQGSKPVTRLIDMDSDQIAKSKDKILLAM